jgi:hypothetical protein
MILIKKEIELMLKNHIIKKIIWLLDQDMIKTILKKI